MPRRGLRHWGTWLCMEKATRPCCGIRPSGERLSCATVGCGSLVPDTGPGTGNRHKAMLVQYCHVPVGYALHLRMLRIETRRHGVGADTMCAAAVDAHLTADDGFSQGYHGKTSLRYLAQQRHRNGPPAAVRGRLPGVPAAMLVDETPTFAHSVAAPIVTVSASRMAAAAGSQGKLVRPACVRLLFYSILAISSCSLLRRIADLPFNSTLFLFLHPATCTLLQVPELSPTKY